MTTSRRTFSDGPPKWVYTAAGMLLAAVHLGLSGFGVRQFAAIWDTAWPFYGMLIATTTAGAVAIHRTPKGGVDQQG